MTDAKHPAGAEPEAPAAATRWLRLTRGFSGLFWGMPALAGVHALSLMGLMPVRWGIGIHLTGFVPLVAGLWRLRVAGDLTPRWVRRIGRVLLLSLMAMYLSPFLVWWVAMPTRTYFAANAAAHYIVMVALMSELCRLAGEGGRWMEDRGLLREARAGLGMVLWLSGCTLAALAILFHRAGLLAEGLAVVLLQLGRLPREARLLFLLPYAMTAYVMWRAKETCLRRMARQCA